MSRLLGLDLGQPVDLAVCEPERVGHSERDDIGLAVWVALALADCEHVAVAVTLAEPEQLSVRQPNA